ncbi:putative autophagy-related protein [Phytophthora cinnamomi]|nr:putative autophagy-related protein [Phytophthora cinnamomi]
MAFNPQGTLLATASESGTLIRVFSVPSGKKAAAFRRGSYGAQVYCLAFNESSTILCASSDTGTIHFFSLTGAESSATGSFGHFTPITSTLAVAGSTFGSTVFGSAAAPPSPVTSSALGSSPGKPASHHPASGVSAPTRTTRTSTGSTASNFDDVAGVMSAYLPSSFSGIAEGTRDFAYARLRSTGVPNQCAIHGPRDAKNPIVQLYVATADGYFYEYSLNLTVGGKCKLERENVLRDSTSEEIEAIYIS